MANREHKRDEFGYHERMIRVSEASVKSRQLKEVIW